MFTRYEAAKGDDGYWRVVLIHYFIDEAKGGSTIHTMVIENNRMTMKEAEGRALKRNQSN